MPRTALKPQLLIPIAAFLATLPLILKGGSCGHDMVFHVQGWYDAASQLRHLHYPHWSFTSAWNAGEPRFIFYPPLSWLLGAFLTLILPPQAAVSTFIFLSLALSGLTMYRLAAHFTTANVALIAAVVYLANPYILLNAFERSAFAELLAAAWIPLLLLAVLRRRPTIQGVAIPLALLWLTNAPAAVMSSYTLALLATLRVVTALIVAVRRRTAHNAPLLPTSYFLLPASLTLTYIAGTVLGLALPAFYLIPAAYERRFIQVAMAVIPGMRVQDNFLFVHTGEPGHDGVNVQISLLAATLYTLTIAAVVALLILHLRAQKNSAIAGKTTNSSIPPLSSVILSEARSAQPKDLPPTQSPAIALAVLTAALILMLSPISIPIWNHLPELHYLQFPWRILTMVSAVLTFAVALLLNRIQRKDKEQHPSPPSYRDYLTILATLTLAFGLGHIGFHLYAQFCQPNEHPADIASLLRAHHGYQPTDEYTPNNADSDVLRAQNPGYWLIPANADPNTGAPNTIPTAAELDPTLQSDDTPIPLALTFSENAPMHLTLHTTGPQHLVFNLRDYPAWDVTESTPLAHHVHPSHITRDDGLLEIPLDHPGDYTIDIRWHTAPDQQLGLALSIAALLTLLYLSFRPRRVTPRSPTTDHEPLLLPNP